jgi:conjugal transfer/entry exclusion protein
LKIINNSFHDIGEIKGFTKDELIEIKRRITKFKSEKSDQADIDDFLKEIFSNELLKIYADYINEIRDFIEQFLISKEESKLNNDFIYQHLKSGILEEIKLISNNLLNLKLNGRNTKRFLKNSDFLNDILEVTQKRLDDINDLIPLIENSLNKIDGIYDDAGYIWFEVNKIKNLSFKFKELPNELEKWEEIKDLYVYIENANIDPTKKKKRKKKDIVLITHFNEIYKFYNRKQDVYIKFYSDLISFLYQINIIEEFESEGEEFEEFINVLDRKEIVKNIKKFLQPIIKALIEDKLKIILNEILELDLKADKNKINLEKLFNQKISIFLPKISDYYLDGLERKYQETISNLNEYNEIKKIANLYSDKINILYSLIEEIDNSVVKFEPFLKPYEEIIKALRKIFDNVFSEISRRKDEYTYYLKTIRRERLRDNIRNFINEKISELNGLMSGYQDETSLIVREEFPQLKQIRMILSDYKVKIQEIKDEVYKKLDAFKEKDIDIYQIIKQWEDNFTLKRQQLSFLLSMILNKLFKNFEGLIEEEDLLFDKITEITEQKEIIDSVPLNFALSNFLVDKLGEEELNERIAKINSRIANLNKEINLYQSELTNLEETLANKVKIREGISSDKIRCGVCHKHINFAKEQIIKCPFCDAVYHYLCVAFWLSKYNSCPSCQNTFLDPNAGMFQE